MHVTRTDPGRQVVTVCGPVDLISHIVTVVAAETLAGHIVFAPHTVVIPGEQPDPARAALEDLHLTKIDLSHRVIIVRRDGAAPDPATARQESYAATLGKVVEYRDIPWYEPSGPVPVIERTTMTNAVAERDRLRAKGYTLDHDDQHTAGELVSAALCHLTGQADDWPWPDRAPTIDRADAHRAAGLLVAELDRVARVGSDDPAGQHAAPLALSLPDARLSLAVATMADLAGLPADDRRAATRQAADEVVRAVVDAIVIDIPGTVISTPPLIELAADWTGQATWSELVAILALHALQWGLPNTDVRDIGACTDAVLWTAARADEALIPTPDPAEGGTVRPEHVGRPVRQVGVPDRAALVEIAAESVHTAWMAAKRGQGITSRQAEDGEELMVPYAHLSERQKDMDRVTAGAAVDALAAAGMVRGQFGRQGGSVPSGQ
jgi:hypothetical protein